MGRGWIDPTRKTEVGRKQKWSYRAKSVVYPSFGPYPKQQKSSSMAQSAVHRLRSVPLLWHKVLFTDFVPSLSIDCSPFLRRIAPRTTGGGWRFSLRCRRLRRFGGGGPFPAASLCRRHSGPRWDRGSGSRKCGGEPGILPHSQPCNGLLPLQGRSG